VAFVAGIAGLLGFVSSGTIFILRSHAADQLLEN